MFRTQTSFVVTGKVLNQDISIEVNIAAPDVDASPVGKMGMGPLIVDTQNVQTVLLSAINGVLINLQHMDAGVNGMSINDIRTGRAAAAARQDPPAPYDAKKDGKLQ